MSLGATSARVRSTNLPGSVGSAIVRRAVRRTLPRRTVVDEVASEIRPTTVATLALVTQQLENLSNSTRGRALEEPLVPARGGDRSTTKPAPAREASNEHTPKVRQSSAVVPPDKLADQSDDDVDEQHWVWGTTCASLTDVQTKQEVCGANERVLLVYPMRVDASTGAVIMRHKRVDSRTAGLSYHWVAIYSGHDDDTYFVNNFSLGA